MHYRVRKCVIRFERDAVYYERACHVVSNDIAVSVENVWSCYMTTSSSIVCRTISL